MWVKTYMTEKVFTGTLKINQPTNQQTDAYTNKRRRDRVGGGGGEPNRIEDIVKLKKKTGWGCEARIKGIVQFLKRVGVGGGSGGSGGV